MMTMAEWIKVATVQDIGPGQHKIVTVGDARIGIVRDAAGNWFAIEDVCTHDGGPLAEGEVQDGCIFCPRHGAKFDLKTGRALTLPAFGKVGVWPVMLEGGDVKIQKS